MKGSDIMAEGFALQTDTEHGDAYRETVGARFDTAVLTAVLLRAETDRHDTPVCKTERHAFRAHLDETRGHIFTVYLPAEGKSVVYLVPAPDCVTPALSLDGGVLSIVCGSVPVVRGECARGEEARLCRAWYRTQYRPRRLVSMSNTWGDRGGRDVVNEEFVRGEVLLAERMGVDAVQVDDGWQKRAPNTYDERGLRVFEGDFWDVQESVFPHGIESVTPYAREHGVQTGLWFAPHSNGMFAHFDRDLSILRRAYREWGFRYFKLDMLQLPTEALCARAADFIREILAFGDDATVELDVTADQRLGYLASAPFGTLFVENRYSAWSNYYPHATLRNLWHLAEYIPTSKLQFELLNPTLFTEKYRTDDPLRPELYDIEYLFASVMVSNPLFWMEMQRLPEALVERLSRMVTLWKAHRNVLVRADVSPIGEEPSGAALTGLCADAADCVHLLLFREVTERDTITVPLEKNLSAPVLLASNAEAALSVENGELHVRLSKPRAFAWIRLEKQ